jgi:hypothetical protein
MESITRFITQKLKVNEAKSAVARPQQRKFLGFSFTDGPEPKRIIAPQALGEPRVAQGVVQWYSYDRTQPAVHRRGAN